MQIMLCRLKEERCLEEETKVKKIELLFGAVLLTTYFIALNEAL